MHIHKTKKIIKVALYSAIIACAAGAATGTLAWYSYQKDVNIGLTGTVIKADKEIQVGLRSVTHNTDFEELYHLGEIDIEDHYKFNSYDSQEYVIYWVKGNYISEVLHSFQEIVLQSAVGSLNAITSGKYISGAPESWGDKTAPAGTWTGFKKQPYNVPGFNTHGGFISKTNRKDYFYLPLVFRAISEDKNTDGSPIYLPNEKIFLSEFITKDLEIDAGGDNSKDLGKAVRCKVDYPSNDTTEQNFIFDPNEANTKNLPVGGKLNLAEDIYYDYYFGNKYQIPYGEWESYVYKDDPTDTEPTLHMNQCTTFRANDLKGGYEIDMDRSVRSVCQTIGASDVVETDYETGHGITVTRLEDCYAFVDLSIYLEGWDENVINLTAGRSFEIDLQFSLL